jgi:AbiU2
MTLESFTKNGRSRLLSSEAIMMFCVLRWKQDILKSGEIVRGPIRFTNPKEKTDLLRRIRLFTEDVAELSSALAIPIVLSRRSADTRLVDVLDKHPAFWNSILSALQTSSHVIVARIHDKAGDAYLKEIKKFLKTRKEGTEVLERIDALEKQHAKVIERMVTLRQKVFAHADFNRPVHEAYGFRDITPDRLEAYWLDLARAARLLADTIFAGEYGPKLDPNQLAEDFARADQAISSVRGDEGS